MKIGIDIMGGDFAPEVNTLGSILAQKELPKDVRLVLIGNEKGTREILAREKVNPNLFDFVDATDVITMNDHPTKAFVRKPESTIARGFDLLKKGEIDVFAGTGNTGAMLVGSILSINNVPGVIRPCITSILPKENGSVGIILDVGSNADCKPDVLYQFGILGSIFAEYVYDIDNPKVGLLNIGEEPEKGNLISQAAHESMTDSPDFNFIGNVEGRDLFSDHVDVIVCDGFTGNIVLKEAEAIFTLMKKRGLTDEYFDRFNYEIYGGTPVLGVNSNVIIGHGISSPTAVKNMILLSKEVVEAELPQRFKEAFR